MRFVMAWQLLWVTDRDLRVRGSNMDQIQIGNERYITTGPVYTGPLLVAGRAACLSKKPHQDKHTLEYQSGDNCVGMIGLAQSLHDGQIHRVRLEMTPEEARDLAMQLLAVAKITGQVG